MAFGCQKLILTLLFRLQSQTLAKLWTYVLDVIIYYDLSQVGFGSKVKRFMNARHCIALLNKF